MAHRSISARSAAGYGRAELTPDAPRAAFRTVRFQQITVLAGEGLSRFGQEGGRG